MASRGLESDNKVGQSMHSSVIMELKSLRRFRSIHPDRKWPNISQKLCQTNIHIHWIPKVNFAKSISVYNATRLSIIFVLTDIHVYKIFFFKRLIKFIGSWSRLNSHHMFYPLIIIKSI